MAIAAARTGGDRRVVAVIGDGAMSAGQAFEALNHAGTLDVNMLVVLNDNDMSISENVGALSNYFARVLSGKTYAALRQGGKKILRRMPTVWELARRSEEHVKGMVLPGTMFEEMGFNYIGPIDGHDLGALVKTLQQPARPSTTAVPAHRHAQGQGLRACGSGSDQVAWTGAVRPRQRHDFQGQGERSHLFAGLWPVAVRHGGAGPAHRRHHARDARRLGPGRVFAALPRALFRRRDRRAARGDARRRTRLRGAATGRRHLLDLPAARVRPVDPRRGAAEPAGYVRNRPRRARRRGRCDAPGCLRSHLPSLHTEHGGHGARGRERVPADALHRGDLRRSGSGPLSARPRPRACVSKRR